MPVGDLVRASLVGLGFDVIDLVGPPRHGGNGRARRKGRCWHHPYGEPQPQAMERTEVAEREGRVHQRGRRSGGAAHRGRERLRLRAGRSPRFRAPGHELDAEHIDAILALDLVDVAAIEAKNFKVVVDAVNSVGGVVVPQLLKALGVKTVVELYCEPNGKFPHNPEPLPEHLQDICALVKKENAHLGICVDPDVDRLALVCEDTVRSSAKSTRWWLARTMCSPPARDTVSNLGGTPR